MIFVGLKQSKSRLSHLIWHLDNNLVVWAGAPLSKKMMSLALSHFELASTTVTGIPMKEEQNANSSANYDVELFHKASAAQV